MPGRHARTAKACAHHSGRASLCRQRNRCKWEEGDDISVLDFTATEYGRAKKVVATDEVKNDIKKIGIKKCARESGFTRFFVRKLLRGRTVRRRS